MSESDFEKPYLSWLKGEDRKDIFVEMAPNEDLTCGEISRDSLGKEEEQVDVYSKMLSATGKKHYSAYSNLSGRPRPSVLRLHHYLNDKVIHSADMIIFKDDVGVVFIDSTGFKFSFYCDHIIYAALYYICHYKSAKILAKKNRCAFFDAGIVFPTDEGLEVHPNYKNFKIEVI